jgi:hypothetical protein
MADQAAAKKGIRELFEERRAARKQRDSDRELSKQTRQQQQAQRGKAGRTGIGDDRGPGSRSM